MLSGEFFLQNDRSSLKFYASMQIWNFAFSLLPKHGLEKDGIFREINDLP